MVKSRKDVDNRFLESVVEEGKDSVVIGLVKPLNC